MERVSGLTKTPLAHQLGVTEKTQCVYCKSAKVRFVDFEKVNRRLDDEKIVVSEIWMCAMCGREFGRLGILYSPQDLNRIRFRIAILTWCGYSAGSLLVYALHFGGIV